MKNISERKVASKAIILSRVSSKEQEEGYSIDAQKYRLQEYCTKKGLGVIRVFEFSESSTITNRTKFMKAIDFAKNQKEIIAIVTDKVDRLQRSHREYNMLDDLISKEKIELHFYTENCIIHKYSTSQERMTWNVHVMMAQNYVDNLKDNINRSIAHKLRCGEWVASAPIGYRHTTSEERKQGKKKIDIDPGRAPLVKKLFEEYATGKYSMLAILRMSKKWGLINLRGNKSYLCQSQLHDTLENPFYYGVMRSEKTGNLYPHIYPPIITKELFDACQKVRLGRKNKSYKYAGKEFIFRGLIRCATTGRIVTADLKTRTSSSGNLLKWTYLILWKPENPEKKMYVREEELIKQIEEVFNSLVIPKELLEQVIEYLEKLAETERALHRKRLGELKGAATKVTNRISALTDSLLDEDIGKEEYEATREELLQKRSEIAREIEVYGQHDDDIRERQINLMELSAKASDIFRGSNMKEKRRLLDCVFLNLKLRGRKLEYDLRPPFNEFISLAKIDEWPVVEEDRHRIINTAFTEAETVGNNIAVI